MTQLAPIVLFCYIRLDTLIQTVEALKNNFLAPDSELYVFCDAAKNDVDKIEVDKVRSYVNAIEGFKSLKVYEATENMGLANSIIQGVSKIFLDHEKIVVLEDDLVTTPNFLNYMNEALMNYHDKPIVNAICGYSFDLKKSELSSSYLLNRPWPWSWATWKNRWEVVDWEMKDYDDFSKSRRLKREFSRLGSDVNLMLWRQMNGKLDSWAIRWTFHQFKTKTFCLYPPVSLVRNIGFGEEATHTKGSVKRYDSPLQHIYTTNFVFPTVLEINPNDQSMFYRTMSVQSRIKSKIETLYLKLKKYIYP
jgi:hypothetical protein